jgi:hypothetical protein
MPASIASQTFGQDAAGQQVGRDEAAGAVKRGLTERQEPAVAEQQVEADAEQTPDEDAARQIDRRERPGKPERQPDQ